MVRNGLVGGVVAVLLSFLPFSTVLGGGVAGYLQAKRDASVARAGAIAGGIAFLPHLIVGSYLILSPTFVPPGPDLGLAPELIIGGVIAFGVIYAIGLGILGALIGKYIHRNHRPT